MDCSTPGFPVHNQFLEPTQTHVHRVSDAIQPSHPLSSPSLPTFSLSQHQGLFQCPFFASGGQSIGVSASTSVLPMNIQDWSPLGWTGWISCSPRESQESSPTPELFFFLKQSIIYFSYITTCLKTSDGGYPPTPFCWRLSLPFSL